MSNPRKQQPHSGANARVQLTQKHENIQFRKKLYPSSESRKWIAEKGIGGGTMSREEFNRVSRRPVKENVKSFRALGKTEVSQKQSPVIATQKGGSLHFSRPITHITGFGKYDMGSGMVKPQKVFSSPEHEKDYKKKKAYKEKVHQGSGDWWEMLKTGASKAFEIAAPHIIEALSGFGDYDVNSNSMLAAGTGGREGSEIPMMCNTKTANVIRHREFICNVLGTTSDFRALTLPIQPGMDETFPWCHLTAQGFTSYKMLGAVIEFNSLYGQISAGGYLGYVAMATQYNSMEPAFTNKESLVTSEYANSKRTDQSFMHPLECSPEQQVLKQQYIRSGDLPDNSDLKFYDLGNFTIATGGQATDNAIVGELWITYEIAFFQPKLARSGANYINADHWTSTLATSVSPFGDNVVQTTGSTMQGSSIATNQYYFPPLTVKGIYKMTYITQSTVPGVYIPPGVSSFHNVRWHESIDLSASNHNVDFPGTGVFTSYSFTGKTFYVEVIGAQAYITFTTATLYDTKTYMDFFISEIPSQIIKRGLIEGTEEWKRRYLQGYQDKTQVSEMLENRILTLQNKLNLVKTREEKKKDLEKEDFEYAPRVIQNCMVLFPEVSKKDVIDIVARNSFDYQLAVSELNLKFSSVDTPEPTKCGFISGGEVVDQTHLSVLGLLQQQNPLISIELIFEIYSFTSKDLLKTTSILYKMSNNVKNGGNPQQYWLNYKWNHDNPIDHPEVNEYLSKESASQSEGDNDKKDKSLCCDCNKFPKYLHFQRCLDCRHKSDVQKAYIRTNLGKM